MRYQTIKRIAGLGLVVVALATPSAVQASLTVHSGWDLFVTGSGSHDLLTGTYWQGVPLGTYDFGGSIGVQDVGMTDTIVQRLTGATAPSYNSWAPTISVVMDALQLETATPTSLLGGPFGNYFVTLDPNYTSGGTMNIYFGPEGDPHGYWNSTMDIYFDIRYGSLNGPIVASLEDQIRPVDLSGNPINVDWRHQAGGEWTIPDVNYLLDGTDIYQDFFPGVPIAGCPDCVYTFVEGGQIVVHDICPEPSSYVLFLCGAAALGLRRFRRTISK